MNVENKFTQLQSTIVNNIKEVILQPTFFAKRVRETVYLKRLHNVFLGIHEEAEYGSKYIITMFVQNFHTKEWMREKVYVNRQFEVTHVKTARG